MAEQLPRGLLADPAMQRAMLLPVARRTFTDPGDDITEELGGLEFAAPGLLYDPMMGMAQTGAMLMGDMPVDPNVVTQTMLDAPLVGGLLGAATGAVPKGTLLGANVFHGGPHRFAPEPDFPHGRPRLDKIGTGEGAQAYGWGVYSAEAPGVATAYRDNLQRMGKPSVKDRTGSFSELLSKYYPASEGKYSQQVEANGLVFQGPDQVVDGIKGGLIKKGDVPDEIFSAAQTFLEPGTLYKLDIPDADIAKYLDYDKPLSEQGEIGQRIKTLISKLETPSKAQSDADRALLDELGVELAEFRSEKFDPFEGVTGGQAYNYITELLGGSGSVFSKLSKGQQAASEALRDIGIPGLKYFDQDSRTRTARATIDGVSINKYKPQNGYEEYIISKFKSGVPFHEIKEIAAMRPEGDALLAKWELKVPEGTRNYVTWDQDVLDRSKMLERDGVTLGANKAPTAALPGLLDDVGIETTQRGNVLEITKIETPDNLRGQGLADQRLEQLIQQADADGTTLALTPSNAFGANKSRLTKWYKRHGFVPNKGRNKDFTTRESMVRPPRNIELGANKAPTAALPGLLQDRSGNIDQRSLLSRTPRRRTSFPMRGLLGQRLYTATTPDGAI